MTPPAAAAAVAVAIVSRCSAPGSPTKARMSMRPGRDDSRRRSRSTRALCRQVWPAARAGPTSAMTPSTIEHAAAASRVCASGSIRRALTSASGEWARCVMHAHPFGRCCGQGLQHRHAHRDAHLDLLADQRLRAVGDDRIDLDAAVHRARDA